MIKSFPAYATVGGHGDVLRREGTSSVYKMDNGNWDVTADWKGDDLVIVAVCHEQLNPVIGEHLIPSTREAYISTVGDWAVPIGVDKEDEEKAANYIDSDEPPF